MNPLFSVAGLPFAYIQVAAVPEVFAMRAQVLPVEVAKTTWLLVVREAGLEVATTKNKFGVPLKEVAAYVF